ncbi:hypothetical protein M758_10G072700 [Ceratodon purpureus]|nr:hypothetical protein M758_10G072700 [Ceratodon purpureus]
MAGEENTRWPQRTITELQDGTNSIDIRAWDEVSPYIREGDIVVNTFPKSGTTWMLQLILQMINNGEETLFAPDNTLRHATSWIENMLIAPTDTVAKFKLTPPHHRRLIKSHLQLDALLFSPKIRYVCVFRDGRDVVMSLYNHCMSQTAEYRNATLKDAKLDDFTFFYENWLLHGNQPFWTDYFHHVQSWWKYANSCDNILLINYNEMQRNLTHVILKLAKFLGIPVDEASVSFRQILHHASFEYMKQHEDLFEPPLNVMKPGNFIHKGVKGRWRDVLTESQHRMYWDKIRQCWPPELIEFVHKDSSS